MLYVTVPSEAPVLKAVTVLNSTSVKVEWRLVPEKKRRGIITKYVISYKAEEEKNKTEEEPKSATVVNGLRQSTTYSFRIWAETVKGAGPASDPKNVTTEGKEIKIIKFSYAHLVFLITSRNLLKQVTRCDSIESMQCFLFF